jgi:class I fructose-bisphosphate aldolase
MGGTGYLSILPVDQGIEHTAGSSFTPNPYTLILKIA